MNTELKDAYDVLMASGWGATTVTKKDLRTGQMKAGHLSPVLKQAFFFEDQKECKDFYICIDSEKRDSICGGDSG